VKKRLAALFCALAIFCALVLPAWGSSGSTVYLLAVNDKFYDGYRPVAINGVIYIPYTVFDRNATGVDLGVYYGITPEQGNILSLYALSGMLTFRVSMGTCEDNLGNQMNFHAVPRNGIPYVPAAAVCDFFGLQYSFLPTTDRGTLIRITNASASMEDGFFLSSAKGAMLHRYNQVIQSQNPQPTAPAATATPSPTATPTPSASPGGKGNVRVFLGVEAYQTDQDLTDFYSYSSNIHALFLFTPDSLPSHASAVRRAVAAGHSIGLVVEGSLEDAQAQLEQGNELLSHIARINTHIVSAPLELVGSLESGGWICWQPNVMGGDLIAGLDSKRSVGYVNAPTSSVAISRFLSQVTAAGYDLRRPLETELR